MSRIPAARRRTTSPFLMLRDASKAFHSLETSQHCSTHVGHYSSRTQMAIHTDHHLAHPSCPFRLHPFDLLQLGGAVRRAHGFRTQIIETITIRLHATVLLSVSQDNAALVQQIAPEITGTAGVMLPSTRIQTMIGIQENLTLRRLGE